MFPQCVLIVRIMRPQRGSSLIEVLISMVILSLGVLGAATYISSSMKNSQSSYVRSQATWLAGDIIDRMRANRTTAQSPPNPYNITFNQQPNGAGVVTDDLSEWRNSLATSLPAGSGSVQYDPATQNVTVIIRWDDSRVLGGANQETFTLETRL